mmetsp:Transcript_19017/g.72666  ORF Transcript_19017/g.72666 Transcript_19017/m.72666 type:complete len:339 (+) Transcript_19017:3-1019(+)
MNVKEWRESFVAEHPARDDDGGGSGSGDEVLLAAEGGGAGGARPSAGSRAAAARSAGVLRVFSAVALSLATLHEHGVVHLDVKADNFLARFDPGPAVARARAAAKRVAASEYDHALDEAQAEVDHAICAADFGEAAAGMFGAGTPCRQWPALPPRSAAEALAGMCSRARGAERIRAPEVIAVDAGLGAKGGGEAAAAVTSAADVWSLGCMLVELLSGKYLYGEDEDDFPRFFLRLTAGGDDDESAADGDGISTAAEAGRRQPREQGGAASGASAAPKAPQLVPKERVDRCVRGLSPASAAAVRRLVRSMLCRNPGHRATARAVSANAARLAHSLELEA